MVLPARSAAVIAAFFLCLACAAPALAQQGPFSSPRLRDEPRGGLSSGQATPTPTASASPSPEPTASPVARDELPNTGADPLRLALAGLTLLGFGFALRFRVALADARRPV